MASYYDDWENEDFRCKNCGWNGIGSQLKQGDMFEALHELDCPQCGGRISTLVYPIITESRANWDKVSFVDKLIIEQIEIRNDVNKSTKLTSPDQLPDLAGDDLILIWDISSRNGGETIIRYGEFELWREIAFYEGYERFIEVAGILSKKYGDRLQDLVPTRKSGMFLFGDRAISIREVKQCRKNLNLKKL